MDIDELLTAAEDALEALEAAAEKEGDKLDDDVAERIRKLREGDVDEKAERKRGKRTKRESDDDDGEVAERKRGKRASDDETDGEREEDEAAERKRSKREDEEVEGIRSVAKTYGRDVVRVVDDLKSLGARASEIRAAVRSAVVARAGSGTPTGSVTPSQRNAPETLDTRAIYAAMNKR